MALIDEDYIRISLRSEAFRVSFDEPFRAVFAFALIGAICWFVSQEFTNFVLLGLIVPLTTGIMSAAGIEILRRRYKFQIAPVGLTCYNFWGMKRTIPWSTMKEVRRFKLFGLDYLRIRAEHVRSEIWLPLFVEKFGLMRDLVGTHVDEWHPLLRQLNQVAIEVEPHGSKEPYR